MSLTNPNKLVTEERLSDFYQQILPYMGGMPEVVNNKFSKGNLYSTDEKMIGQWIDGRPLYQKTWTGLSLSSNTNWYSTGISIDFVKTIINGFTIDNMEQNISSSYGVDSSTKILYLKNTWNGQIISQITLQYTKTADSPIAIGSDTDYSTEEKIVGTWIDGKPIYQKTFTGLNVNVPVGSASTNWTNLVQIENIEMAINIACFTSSKQLISMNEVNISNNYVQVQGTFEARTIVTAILQYTKSTD